MVKIYPNQNRPLLLITIFSATFVTLLLILFLKQQQQIFQLQSQISSLNQTTPIPSLIPTASLPTTSLPTPTKIPTVTYRKAEIMDTSGWQEHTCFNLSFKLPADKYNVKCSEDGPGYQNVLGIHKDGIGLPAFNIFIRKYDGGSRRQYWIGTQNASPAEVSKYLRFEETMYGSVSALAVYGDGGWWQGGYNSPILIAKGSTIVLLHGGNLFNADTNTITRHLLTSSMASTIQIK
jgi:hypothetical protein